MSTDLVNLPEGQVLPPKPQRDKNGQLLPGNSANPLGIGAGRPRTKFISEALNQRLENEGEAEILADKLLQHAKTGKPSVSLAATSIILDRTEGRAIQHLRVEQTVDSETIRRLAELAEMFTDSR